MEGESDRERRSRAPKKSEQERKERSKTNQGKSKQTLTMGSKHSGLIEAQLTVHKKKLKGAQNGPLGRPVDQSRERRIEKRGGGEF